MLAILAMLSTSVSVSFGLLSTATPTILFGSRIRIGALLARALHRQRHALRDGHRRDLLQRDVRRLLGVASVGLGAGERLGVGARVEERRVGVGRGDGRRLDAARAKNARISRGHVGAREERRQRRRAESPAASRPRRARSPDPDRSTSSISRPSCSCARGASAPCAASRRMSRATSPRRKKSSSGVRRPASMAGWHAATAGRRAIRDRIAPMTSAQDRRRAIDDQRARRPGAVGASPISSSSGDVRAAGGDRVVGKLRR